MGKKCNSKSYKVMVLGQEFMMTIRGSEFLNEIIKKGVQWKKEEMAAWIPGCGPTIAAEVEQVLKDAGYYERRVNICPTCGKPIQ